MVVCLFIRPLALNFIENFTGYVITQKLLMPNICLLKAAIYNDFLKTKLRQQIFSDSQIIQALEMVQILTYGLSKKMTEAEAYLWNCLLKDNQMLGYSFDRRIEVLHHNAAFLSLDLMLIIEIDSSFQQEETLSRKDKEKELLFRLGGYTVLRFTENEIISNIEKVKAMIKEWIVLNAN